MRFRVLPISTFVHLHILICIYWQRRVRIDGDKKQARVGLPRISPVRRKGRSAHLTYMRSDWYLMCKLCTTEASLRWVSSAMSSALSNFAGLTWSVDFESTSLCCNGILSSSSNAHTRTEYLTLPSSHCTTILLSATSSTTHAFTNADFES